MKLSHKANRDNPYASLSARRAWIETVLVLVVRMVVRVALRKEGVD